jgi:hypothetical protein
MSHGGWTKEVQLIKIGVLVFLNVDDAFGGKVD